MTFRSSSIARPFTACLTSLLIAPYALQAQTQTPPAANTPIGDNSADAYAGTLMNMFRFDNPPAKAVILDPTTGLVAANGNSGVTKAVANPKGGFATWIEAELDGTSSRAADGGALTYSWTQSPFANKQATIIGANTATLIVVMGNGPGTYPFILTVTDSAGNQSSDTASLVLM